MTGVIECIFFLRLGSSFFAPAHGLFSLPLKHTCNIWKAAGMVLVSIISSLESYIFLPLCSSLLNGMHAYRLINIYFYFCAGQEVLQEIS